MAPELGPALRSRWSLEPDAVFLNHGSFGATPTAVLAEQARWRARLEAQPVRFMMRERPQAIRLAAADLAAFVGSAPEDLAFVQNASAGVGAVLRSLRFEPGDRLLCFTQVYPAVRSALRFVCERWGCSLVEVCLPAPLSGPDEVVARLEGALQQPVALAVLDHITSATGLVLPIAELVAACRAKGVPTLVDGAHAPGQLPLDLAALDADYYVGNCHKWLWAPKGCAFLRAAPRAQPGLHPPVLSHGHQQGFTAEFDFCGTDDPSAWLSISEALRFHAALGDAAVRAYNRGLALAARALLCEALDAEPAGPERMVGNMAALRLPQRFGSGSLEDAKGVHDALWETHRIEVPITPFAGGLWLRVSAQVYNGLEEYQRLAEALLSMPAAEV